MKTNRNKPTVTQPALKTDFLSSTPASAARSGPRRVGSRKYSIRGLLAIALIACVTPMLGATIGASGDTSMPSQISTYTLGTPINETIAFDPTRGPWLKDLVNGGSGI